MSKGARRRTIGAVVVAVAVVVGVAWVVRARTTHHPDTYVALGDSYAAGAGITAIVSEPWACFRSPNSYPRQVEHALTARHVAALVLHDTSCNGARLRDLHAPQHVTGGVNPTQLDSIDAHTKTVTLTVGANDIGFPSFSMHCFVDPDPGGCRKRYADGDDLRAALTGFAPRFADTLDEIHARAPDADVFVVGYPTILPADGSCPDLDLPASDVAYIAEVLRDLNTTLQRTAAAHGATYVDTATSSVGHDVCAGDAAWIAPPGVDLAKDRDGLRLHPNRAGTAHTARLVTAAIIARRPG